MHTMDLHTTREQLLHLTAPESASLTDDCQARRQAADISPSPRSRHLPSAAWSRTQQIDLIQQATNACARILHALLSPSNWRRGDGRDDENYSWPVRPLTGVGLWISQADRSFDGRRTRIDLTTLMAARQSALL